VNGFAICNGQLLPISENDTLFNLIGTTYGGDGEETFGLPNLQSRVPMHMGQANGDGLNYVLAATGGQEQVILVNQQIPNHSHFVLASSAPGNASSPAGTVFAASSANQYVPANTGTPGALGSIIGSAGGGQQHNNLQPYLAITFQISLFGVFPTPN